MFAYWQRFRDFKDACRGKPEIGGDDKFIVKCQSPILRASSNHLPFKNRLFSEGDDIVYFSTANAIQVFATEAGYALQDGYGEEGGVLSSALCQSISSLFFEKRENSILWKDIFNRMKLIVLKS